MTEGIAEIGFARDGGVTRLTHLYQRDPLRVMFPTTGAGDPPLAMIVTTSGGLVAGDRLDIAVRAEADTAAHITSSAAEKVYRSTGRTTTISQFLSVDARAIIEFLPLETILFDGARLNRQTVVELGPASGFLGGDIVVFGRRARGERLTHGFVREVWQVRRNGKLIWGDALHLEDDVARLIDDPACFDGAAAFASMILSPPHECPQGFLGAAPAIRPSDPAVIRAGVTTVAGLVIARWLAYDTAALRRAYADLASRFRSAALGLPSHLPRSWHF
ncbi:MAG: urease accessory protein UreD [Alphaproteobacteria bacterium]|nr:urease accessory protein UreD [Alphaproteobacteria bacterium]